MHWFLKVESLGETRCRKSWNQFKGYGSPSLRYVKRVSRKRKDHRWEKINVKVLHQRSPYAMKFEDRSHEQTERQQRCARSKSWNFAKNIFKFKEKDKATFYFPAEELGTPGCVNKRAGGKRVCSFIQERVCIWSVSETLNSAELETMKTSRSPTTVMTANGEVQTREEATVYVKQLDLFVKVMLLEQTPAFLSLAKLCGYTHHWTSGQKPHLIRNGKRIDCNISNYVPIVVLGISEFFFNYTFTNFSIIFITGFLV